jgi:hypothetical protein
MHQKRSAAPDSNAVRAFRWLPAEGARVSTRKDFKSEPPAHCFRLVRQVEYTFDTEAEASGNLVALR